jgi:hypothetical protein
MEEYKIVNSNNKFQARKNAKLLQTLNSLKKGQFFLLPFDKEVKPSASQRFINKQLVALRSKVASSVKILNKEKLASNQTPYFVKTRTAFEDTKDNRKIVLGIHVHRV